MTLEITVTSTGERAKLSPEAEALLLKPVPILPWVEDAYRVTTAQAAPGRWFVVFVRPTHGTPERVERYGHRLGLSSYWPKRVRLVIRGRGQKRRSVAQPTPLMNRYVLMSLPERDPPFGLLTSQEGRFQGVCGFLSNAAGPVEVPIDVVDRLKDRERDGEFDETIKRGRKTVSRLPPWCQVNEIVRIASGPFVGLTAMVEEHMGTGKLKVGVMLFGSSTPIDMGLEQLAPLG